ncbi:bile acid:sodium symporter family protein [Neptunicella sp. SCSIO 80796]|uniref:bile acid:sodium symporter family protein n=1 Tax=Neptunicella plasticusilytica TaxID=3117012 RepID=UPI003A4DDFA4
MSDSSLLALNLILALMMFGIALSLKVEDFKRVFNQPKAPLTAIVAQFLLLPAISWLLTMLLPLPAEVALGVILVGSCPGGSFSNIMTFLSKGNTALSVSITALSSLAAAVATPFNFVLYSSLNPDTASLLRSIHIPVENVLVLVLLVLALPLLLGLITAYYAPRFAERSQQAFKIISLLTLFGFVGAALSQNWQKFSAGANIFMAIVVLHNAIALGIGRITSGLMKLNSADTRAVTLELGIQNSGLGLGIIFTFFDQLGGMAIIAASWGIWHLISGLSLTLYWSRRDIKQGA